MGGKRRIRGRPTTRIGDAKVAVALGSVKLGGGMVDKSLKRAWARLLFEGCRPPSITDFELSVESAPEEEALNIE